MSRRHRRHREAAAIAFGGILLSLLAGFAWIVFILAHVLVLVLAVAAVAVAYRIGQRRKQAVRLVRARPGDDRELAGLRAENARLHAQVSQLRQQTEDATIAMHAAWDAASSVTPGPRPELPAARARLLADPLGGVRELGGPR